MGLLTEAANAEVPLAVAEDLDDDALAGRTGDRGRKAPPITELKHVRSTAAEKKAAEEIARRDVCEDFAILQTAYLTRCKSELFTGWRSEKREAFRTRY